jgi:hypothetical protein
VKFVCFERCQLRGEEQVGLGFDFLSRQGGDIDRVQFV